MPTKLPQPLPSDAELARAAQSGDRAAFVEIVARHQALVCGTAYGILSDFAASEDAGQEAFLNAWRKIGDLREPEKLRPWLAQIARNVALGKLRGQRDGTSLDEIAQAVDEKPLPDELVASEEEAALVRGHLAELPEKYRMPLVLFYREGKSVRAVAEALEISEDAVKKRLERGRAQLRDRVEGLIESTLQRTAPSAVFTMAVATAIGALKAPAAVAAGAFAGSTTAAGSTVVANSSGQILTAMTASQIPYVAAAVIAAACLPIGYSAHRSLEDDGVDPGRVESSPVVERVEPRDPVVAWPDSELLAEWRRLHEKHGSGAEAMPLILAEIQNMSGGFRRRAFGAALAAEWAQLDPAGGFQYLSGKKNRELQRQLFGEWVKVDADAAIDLVLSECAQWKRLAREQLKEFARLRPERLNEVVAKLPSPRSFFDKTVADAFALLAERGIDGAKRATGGLKGRNRQQALAGIAKVLAKRDVDGAMAWVMAMPEGQDRDEILRFVMLGQAEVSPLAALDKIKLVPPGGNSSYFASTTGARVLKVAADTDFEGTLGWLVEHSEEMGGNELTGIAGHVTSGLNQAADEFLDARVADGSLEVILPAINSAIMNDSEGQIDEIWAWLQEQDGGVGVGALRSQVLQQAGYSDPISALAMASSMQPDAMTEELGNTVTSAVLAREGSLNQFDELFAAAPEFLQGALVERAFERFTNFGSIGEPRDWVARLEMVPALKRSRATESLASVWVKNDPREAAEWVDERTAEGGGFNETVGLVDAWSRSDPMAASQWVAEIPEGRVRDVGARELARNIAEELPHEAWLWAMSIDNRQMQAEALDGVVRRIARSPNQEGVDLPGWIEGLDVEAAVRDRLLERLEGSGK